jgi:zinc metalloprotease ZmpB
MYQKLYVALLGLALGIGGGSLMAQKPQAPRSFEIPLQIEEPSYMLDEMRMSAWTDKPLALYNLRERAQSADAETAARKFMQDRASLLGLRDPELGDLTLRASRESLAGTTLRFSQFFKGVQVYESETVINLSPDHHITFLLNGYKSIAPDFDANASIVKEQARDLVASYVGLSGRIDYDQTKLVVYHSHNTTRLAWNVRLVGEEPIGDWEALVDAKTAEIFKCQDVSCYHQGKKLPFLEPAPLANVIADPVVNDSALCDDAPLPMPLPATVNGTGNTFDPDPLSTAGAAYAGSYVDGNDANAAVLTAELKSRTLNSITFNAGVHSLVGPYATIIDFEAPAKGLFSQASSTFAFDRNADAFEAVNTYYMLDQSLRYINVTLGISLMPFQYAGGMQFDPSGLSGADNSHYIGSTGRIAFGEGGVDDAEDADVILHEMGHGLHDWATSGSLSQVNGLSEGCGDYWAQSYSRAVAVWTPAQPAYHWVFSWDGHNPFWGGRTTNYAALYPSGLVNQIHTDGQIWATCLMKIYDAIGRTKTDRAFLEGLMLTNSTTNQQDAAIAFRQAGINMGYTASELTQITNFLTGCGYIMPPFPVQYGSFAAERLNAQYVNLNWETASESQNNGFEVQRRLATETEFATMGFVKGNGTTDDRSTYAFQDINPSNEMSFYRLRQLDLDGYSRLSEVLAVAGSNVQGFAFGISPNPVKDRLEAIVVGLGAGHVTYQITDLSGKVIADGEAVQGMHLSIPGVDQLASGVYLLELQVAGQSAVQKFVKE